MIYLTTMSKNIINERFNEVIKYLKEQKIIVKNHDIAAALNCSPQIITEILGKRMNVQLEMLQNLFDKFNVSYDYIFNGKGSIINSIIDVNQDKLINNNEENPPHLYLRVPLIPANAVAGFSNGDVQVNDYDVLDHYVIPEFSNKGVKYLIRASGSSMYPKYSNGDLLACRPITDSSFLQWGKVYVLDTDQGPLVKRLFQCRQNDDAIECHSDNKEHYPPFVLPKTSIRKISIVVGVIRLE